MLHGTRWVFTALTFASVVVTLPQNSAPRAFAQTYPGPTVSYNAQDLVSHAAVFLSPASESVIEGSTFQVSVYLNTMNSSVNAIDVTVQFPADKLQIVSPTGGVSLVRLWVQPPTYSNTRGTAHFAGTIPNGIVTQSGLITTITFKAIAPGTAPLTITPDSSLLANDGLGTPLAAEFSGASYVITPQPPAGVPVSSPTHPFPSTWYNNNSPSFVWQTEPGNNGFSYVLDNKPFTVPNNTINTTDTTAAFPDLGDGRWYFHIKAQKLGVWGGSTNFLAQIDTQPPAEFTPGVDVVPTKDGNKIIVSFATTDSLSGIDHYEVAVLDPSASDVTSPVFIQSESPYTFEAAAPGNYEITVRAFDDAGNVRDATRTITIQTPFIEYLKQHDLAIILGLLVLVLLLFILHYFFGHKLLRRVHRMIVAVEEAERREKLDEAKEAISEGREDERSGPPAAQ